MWPGSRGGRPRPDILRSIQWEQSVGNTQLIPRLEAHRLLESIDRNLHFLVQPPPKSSLPHRGGAGAVTLHSLAAAAPPSHPFSTCSPIVLFPNGTKRGKSQRYAHPHPSLPNASRVLARGNEDGLMKTTTRCLLRMRLSTMSGPLSSQNPEALAQTSSRNLQIPTPIRTRNCKGPDETLQLACRNERRCSYWRLASSSSSGWSKRKFAANSSFLSQAK